MSILPSTPTLAEGQTQQFTATVANAPDNLPAASFPAVSTVSYDTSRTAANLAEAILTPSNVATSLSRLGSFSVDGYIYAQPLLVGQVTLASGSAHDLLIVSTMNNSVFAFDANSPGAAALWSINLGPTFFSPPNGQLLYATTGVGIVSTPVIDVANKLLYVVYSTVTQNIPNWVLAKIDLTSGQVLNRSTITGQVVGAGDSGDPTNGPYLVFYPRFELQRPGLTFANSRIYIAFGSYGDPRPMHGWVFAYDAGDLTQKAVICLSPNSWGAPIWQSGGGLAVDSLGNLYVATGNGAGGSDLSEALVKLDQNLNVLAYIQPSNWMRLSIDDRDFSGRPMVVPGQSLIVAGAKDSNLYGVDLSLAGALQIIPVAGSQSGIFNGAVFNGRVYTSNGPIFANPLNGASLGSTAAITSNSFSHAPALSGSCNGSSNCILWATTSSMSAFAGPVPGTLRAFNASTLAELYNSDSAADGADTLGRLAKFVIPVVVAGRVYVATQDNKVQVYGVPVSFAPYPQPITGSAVTWSITPNVGTISSAGVYTAPAIITGSQTVTITAASLADWTKSASATITLTPGGPGQSIWSTNTAPTLADSGAGGAVEVGVKFKATVNGTINGIRFYKSAANTGMHVASLWTAGGSLMASATFTGETGSGWQTVTLNSPIPITAGTVYVASYHTNVSHFSADLNYFATTGVINLPLQALANGVSGSNGVYAYASTSTFPNNSYSAANYWVDVVFSPATTSPLQSIAVTASNLTVNVGSTQQFTATGTYGDGSTQDLTSQVIWNSLNTAYATISSAGLATGVAVGSTQISASVGAVMSNSGTLTIQASPPPTCPCTIWSNHTVPTVTDSGAGGAVEVGVKFQAAVNGTINGIRFYKSAANTGTHIGNLWTSSGSLLGSATFTSEAGSGWQTATFNSPIPITAGTVYVASYHTNVSHFSADLNYFATTGVINLPLQALANGVSGGNGVYAYASTSTFPNNSYSAANYWVDVVFSPTPTAPLQSIAVTASSLTVNVGSTQQFRATGTYGDGSTQDLTSQVTWNSLSTTYATISSAGLATGLATGSTQISASLGAVMSNSETLTIQAAPPPTCPCTIWSTNTAPTLADSGAGGAVEVGVKFKATVNGTINGIRFYKSAANTGMHVASLWTAGGSLMASATFTGETGSGWQTVTLNSPIPITAGTVYVASYHTNVSHFSADLNYFATTGVINLPLQALANGVSGSNGVYAYASTSTFPNNSYSAANYWVDVVFSPATTSPLQSIAVTASNLTVNVGSTQQFTATGTYGDGSTQDLTSQVIWNSLNTAYATISSAGLATGVAVGSTQISASVGAVMSNSGTLTIQASPPPTCPCTIWSNHTVPTVTDSGAGGAVEVGVKFQAAVNGTINGIRFYKSAANTGTHIGNLWTSSGSLLGSATFTSEAGSGWQTATFNSPIPITAGTVYVASYHTNVSHFSADLNYFATTGVINLPLQALANGVSGGNGVYAYASTSTFPNNSYSAANYWVDVVFSPTPTAPLQSIAVTASSLTVNVGSTQQFRATGTYGDGSTQDLTSQVTWNSLSTTYATISSAGLATGLATGSTQISASLAGVTSDSATLTIQPSECPCSIWNSNTMPVVPDTGAGGAVEVGVKFKATVNGTINGIRFYKSAANTGTHIGNLWTSTGSLLGSAIFTSETGSGWQTVTLNSPIPITAGTVYVASYHTNVSHFSADLNYFASTGVINLPLQALANGVSGSNGVYAYASTSTFPNNSYSAANYWVDVMFSPTIITPTLQSIAVAPASPSIAKGLTQQFTAIGTYTDGSTLNLTSQASWNSATPATATITSPGGLATGLAVGTSGITASFNGVTSPTDVLTVTQAALVSIAVAPASPSIAKGLTQQFTATGTYTDGSTLNLTSQASWNSATPATATITSPGGLATGLAVGTSNITASMSGVTSPADVLMVTAPVLVSIAVTPANPSVAIGYTEQFTATGTFSDGSMQNLTSVGWNSSATDIAVIDATGVATSKAQGSTTISASLNSITGQTTLTVTGPTLVSIAVTPASSSVAIGSTQQFTATGTFSDNTTQNLMATVTWQSTSTNIATVDAAGLASAAGFGSTTIEAALGTINGSTSLSVTAGFVPTGSLSTGRLNPNATLLNNGTVLVAGGFGSGGIMSSAELYNPATKTFVATGSLNTAREYATATLLNLGTILVAGGSDGGGALSTAELYNPANGTFTTTGRLNAARYTATATLLNNGTVLIAAGYGADSGLSSAELYNPAAGTFTTTGSLSIARSSATATLLNNGEVLIAGGSGSEGYLSSAELYDPATGTFTATGNLSTARAGATATLLNNGMVLIAGGESVNGILSSAELYNPAVGAFTATGSLNTGRVNDTATLLNNDMVLVAGGDGASAFMSSAELYDPATGTFTSAGSLNAGRSDATATRLNDGSVLIAAGFNGPAIVNGELYEPDTLTPPNLVSIAVIPANPTIPLDAAQQFIATGTFSDTSTQQLAAVTWTSSDSSILTITNDSTNLGHAYGVAQGAATVTACAGSVCGSTGTTVGSAALVSIAVTPASPSIAKGLTQQFTAIGTYTDGSTLNLTSQASWNSATPATATITSPGGLATGLAVGTSGITASFNGVTSPTDVLTVTQAALVSIAVAPASPSIAKGLTQQFTATGTYTDGSTLNLTSQASWNSATPATATITSPGGLATGLAVGTSNITASMSGVTSPADVLMVTAPVLVSIAVTPANPSVAIGYTEQFTATGTFSDGSMQNLTSVGWNSSATDIAVIDATGVATSKAQGSTTISASLNSITGQTTLTVTGPTLVSIAVTPASSSVAIGSTQQFTATGTFSDNTTQNLMATVTWQSTSTSVATVDAAGLASAVAVGSATIEASSAGINGSSIFTVQAGFTSTSNLQSARYQHTATLLDDGTVLLAGGTGANGPLSTAEIYDPTTSTFSLTMGFVNTARQLQTASLLNDGTVLIAGGTDGDATALNSAELYYSNNQSFVPTSAMNSARYRHTATVLGNGMVLLAGGTSGSTSLSSAELYDPQSDIFTQTTAAMNSPRVGATATLLNNGMVLIVGGTDSSGNALTSAELYDPSGQMFTLTGSMNMARSGATATLLNGGFVLIAGGMDSSGQSLSGAELYDPSSQTFLAVGPLSVARFLHTATLLQSGKVLISGGEDSEGNVLSSTEIYDPAAEMFSSAANLSTPRAADTATILNSGFVLIAGGAGSTSGSVLSSAEIYEAWDLIPADWLRSQ